MAQIAGEARVNISGDPSGLNDALKKASSKFKGFSDYISSFGNIFKSAFGYASTAISAFSSEMSQVVSASQRFNVSIATARNALKMTEITGMRMKDAIDKLKKSSEKNTEADRENVGLMVQWKMLISDIGDVIEDVGGAILKEIAPAFPSIIELSKVLANIVTTYIIPAFGGIANLISNLPYVMASTWSAMGEIATSVGKYIYDAITNALLAAGSYISDWWDFLGSGFADVFAQIRQAAYILSASVKDSISAAMNTTIQVVATALEKLTDLQYAVTGNDALLKNYDTVAAMRKSANVDAGSADWSKASEIQRQRDAARSEYGNRAQAGADFRSGLQSTFSGFGGAQAAIADVMRVYAEGAARPEANAAWADRVKQYTDIAMTPDAPKSKPSWVTGTFSADAAARMSSSGGKKNMESIASNQLDVLKQIRDAVEEGGLQ